MALTAQLSDLRTRAQRRVDQEYSNLGASAEITHLVNQAVRKIYDEIVDTNGGREYYATSVSFNTVSGTAAYSFASMLSPGTEDILRVIGVEAKLDGSEWRTLRTMNTIERNVDSTTGWGFFRRPRYYISGRGITFVPAPLAVYSCRMLYVPHATTLVNDTDTFDGVNGWDEFVELDVAIQLGIKEGIDVSELVTERKLALQRVRRGAKRIDGAFPRRFADTERLGSDEWR